MWFGVGLVGYMETIRLLFKILSNFYTPLLNKHYSCCFVLKAWHSHSY